MSEQEQSGPKWGDDIETIPLDRRNELTKLEEQQIEWAKKPESERGDSPFQGQTLTGAEVYFLAQGKRVKVDEFSREDFTPKERVFILHNNLFETEGDATFLTLPLHLEGVDLRSANLTGAHLTLVYLENAVLSKAHLENSKLQGAHLDRCLLTGVYLERANLAGATLREANLEGARLNGTILSDAHLESANLNSATLEGVDLTRARMDNCNLSQAFVSKVRLNGANLNGVFLDQATLSDINLGVVDWGLVHMLGDECRARERETSGLADEERLLRAIFGTRVFPEGLMEPLPTPKTRKKRASEFSAAGRAYRALAAALQPQGLTREADRFMFRSQICQRRALRYQQNIGELMVSTVLWLTAGYGYRLQYIFYTYVGVLTLFTIAYFVTGQIVGTPLAWPDAILVSFTAVHGRVFLGQFGLHSALSWIAGIEAVVGIVIEGIFVAMLIQRFFAR